MFTMLLTDPPPARGPLAATRGPRVAPPVVVEVTEPWRESPFFAGDALRGDADPERGDVARA